MAPAARPESTSCWNEMIAWSTVIVTAADGDGAAVGDGAALVACALGPVDLVGRGGVADAEGAGAVAGWDASASGVGVTMATGGWLRRSAGRSLRLSATTTTAST